MTYGCDTLDSEAEPRLYLPLTELIVPGIGFVVIRKDCAIMEVDNMTRTNLAPTLTAGARALPMMIIPIDMAKHILLDANETVHRLQPWTAHHSVDQSIISALERVAREHVANL
jgi:hypothetical protein